MELITFNPNPLLFATLVAIPLAFCLAYLTYLRSSGSLLQWHFITGIVSIVLLSVYWLSNQPRIINLLALGLYFYAIFAFLFFFYRVYEGRHRFLIWIPFFNVLYLGYTLFKETDSSVTKSILVLWTFVCSVFTYYLIFALPIQQLGFDSITFWLRIFSKYPLEKNKDLFDAMFYLFDFVGTFLMIIFILANASMFLTMAVAYLHKSFSRQRN